LHPTQAFGDMMENCLPILQVQYPRLASGMCWKTGKEIFGSLPVIQVIISFLQGKQAFNILQLSRGLASNYGAIHLYEDKAGNIWFGTVRGAYRYDARLNEAVGQGIFLPTGQAGFQFITKKEGQLNNDINTIMEDKTGNLWFGTRGHLSVYNGKTFTFLKNKDGKTFTNVWGITEDRKGNIWFGDVDGLWRYDGGTFTKVSEKGAYAIIEDKNGNIWTTGADEPSGYGQVWSLSRYDQKSLYDKKPIVTEIMSGQTAFLGLLEADDGSIWFGSMNGVYRYDGKTITDFKVQPVSNNVYGR
jgi:ligand-binding sensor domain-containing protein